MDLRAVTRPWERRSGQRKRRYPADRVARAAGRVVLWLVIAVVLVRGVGAILTEPQTTADHGGRGAKEAAGFPDAEARAFAVSFTHAYLSFSGDTRDRQVLARFVSEGLGDQAMPVVSRRGPGAQIAWAMVAREKALGASRALITVALIYRDGTRRYLTVPVARDESGGLAVFDLPAFVGPPPGGTAEPVEPVPLSGSEAGPITDLIGRFLTRYIAGAAAGELAWAVGAGRRRRAGLKGRRQGASIKGRAFCLDRSGWLGEGRWLGADRDS